MISQFYIFKGLFSFLVNKEILNVGLTEHEMATNLS